MSLVACQANIQHAERLSASVAGGAGRKATLPVCMHARLLSLVGGDLSHHIIVPIILAFWVLQEVQAALRPTPFTACTGESLVTANPSLLDVRGPPFMRVSAWDVNSCMECPRWLSWTSAWIERNALLRSEH